MFRLFMLPIVYACIVGTIFRDWQHAHPIIANGIFVLLAALPVMLCAVRFVRFIKSLVALYRGQA